MAQALQDLVAQFQLTATDEADEQSNLALPSHESRPETAPRARRALAVILSGLFLVCLVLGVIAWSKSLAPTQSLVVVEPTYLPTPTLFPTPTLTLFIAPQVTATALPPTAGPNTSPTALPGSVTATVAATQDVPFHDVWANSAHAQAQAVAFTHWNAADPPEIPATCAKRHSTAGFQDFVGADGSAPGKVDAPAPIGGGITCSACHNSATSTLSSVSFPSGIVLKGLGPEARCIACHQGRASKASVEAAIKTANATDVDTPNKKLTLVNIHYGTAAATEFGAEVQSGYEYAGQTYAAKFEHVAGFNTCLGCHDPHSLEIKFTACQACHKNVNSLADLKNIRGPNSVADYNGKGNVAEGVYFEVAGLQTELLQTMETYASEVAKAPLVRSPDTYPYFFFDKNRNGQADEDEVNSQNSYAAWTPRLLKAAYNYQLSINDPGAFAHNGPYVIELLYDSIADLNSKISKPALLTARPEAASKP